MIKSILFVFTILTALVVRADNDSQACSNPTACPTIVRFQKDSPLNGWAQGSIILALQNKCKDVVNLTEKETTKTVNGDVSIYKSVLTGSTPDANGHPYGYEIYVTVSEVQGQDNWLTHEVFVANCK